MTEVDFQDGEKNNINDYAIANLNMKLLKPFETF